MGTRRIRRAGLALAAMIALSASPFKTPAFAAEPEAAKKSEPAVKERIPDVVAPETKPAAASGEAKMVGRAVCATCHTDKEEGFDKTFHGRKSLSQPKLANACESCHGAGSLHAESGGIAKITNPKKLDAGAVADLCLNCHKNKAVMLWKTSHHAQNGLSCLQCHSVHTGEGRTSLKAGAVFEEKIQTETCLKCHKKQKADMRLASHHPVPEGKMACVSCHNPHGGVEGNLKADSSEELCARCHAEKVGPFAYEHPPVADGCTNCHLPHGSANDKLLKQAPPYLCMSCHKYPHTVSVATEEQRGSCMDCHKEIHGSDRKSTFKD